MHTHVSTSLTVHFLEKKSVQVDNLRQCKLHKTFPIAYQKHQVISD